MHKTAPTVNIALSFTIEEPISLQDRLQDRTSSQEAFESISVELAKDRLTVKSEEENWTSSEKQKEIEKNKHVEEIIIWSPFMA